MSSIEEKKLRLAKDKEKLRCISNLLKRNASLVLDEMIPFPFIAVMVTDENLQVLFHQFRTAGITAKDSS
jgi:hypothetical protein